jgi:hypothetical protein
MQERMFFEDINDALKEVVNALGGAKKVGPLLWPEKTVEQAQSLLLACLNPERKERITPEQFVLILKWGRQAGAHAAINYLCQECGYSMPTPIEPRDELSKLQRDYIDAVNRLSLLAPKIEEAQAKLAVVK